MLDEFVAMSGHRLSLILGDQMQALYIDGVLVEESTILDAEDVLRLISEYVDGVEVAVVERPDLDEEPPYYWEDLDAC